MLALDTLCKVAKVGPLERGHGGCTHRRCIVEGLDLQAKQMADVHAALAAKDASELKSLLRQAPQALARALCELPSCMVIYPCWMKRKSAFARLTA
jgi:hypothetical protein